MNFSYWEKATFIKHPDVIVIGSGIVGLFAALRLKHKSPKLHILVLERGILPYGASTKNAGFACYGSAGELIDDLQNHTESEVFSLVEKRWKGLHKLRETLGDKIIGYEPFGGYELFTPEDKNSFENCYSQLAYLNKHLYSISGEKEMYRLADEKINSFGFQRVDHLIVNKGEGQLHTGRMMQALIANCRASGVEILNGAFAGSPEDTTKGIEIRLSGLPGHTSYNQQEVLHAKRLLICTNGFARNFLPGEDVLPARAQVLITSPIENLKIKGCFHYEKGYYYFRNVENRILFGGGRNLDFANESTEEFGLTNLVQSKLECLLQTMILPGAEYKIEMRWSGIMGLGNHKSPIVKRTGQNIFCAVRMGGMGIAIGSMVGEEGADMILETL